MAPSCIIFGRRCFDVQHVTLVSGSFYQDTMERIDGTTLIFPGKGQAFWLMTCDVKKVERDKKKKVYVNR